MPSFSAALALTLLSSVSLSVLAPAQSNLVQEDASAMHGDRPPASPSTSLAVRVGDRTVNLSLTELQDMPQTTVSVFNAHSKQTESYSGPLVADVLARAGLTLSEKTQHGLLDTYVVASGTDGYFVVFSGAELQPGLHKAQALIAIAQAGQPLTRTGAFQLIDAADVKPARWVRNLNGLTVVPVPSPVR